MLLACGSRHQFQIPPTTAGGEISHPVHLSQNAYIISQGDGHRNIGPIADYNTGIGNINPALIGNPQRVPAREIQPRRPYLIIVAGPGLRCPNGSIVATPGMWSVTRRSSVGAAWVNVHSSQRVYHAQSVACTRINGPDHNCNSNAGLRLQPAMLSIVRSSINFYPNIWRYMPIGSMRSHFPPQSSA